MALSHDQSLLAVLDANSRLRVLDPYTLTRRYLQLRSRRRFLTAHFEPESSRLLALVYSSLPPHTLRVTFDYKEGTEVTDEWCDQPFAFSVFRSDGRVVAFLTFDGVDVREWATNQRIAKWPADELTTDMMFSPDGTTIALWHEDFVQLWDVASGTQRFSLVGHRGMVLCATFSPDGKWIATGGADREVRLWDGVKGIPIATYDWEIGPVRAIAFAPDGLTCAAGGESGDVVIWDV